MSSRLVIVNSSRLRTWPSDRPTSPPRVVHRELPGALPCSNGCLGPSAADLPASYPMGGVVVGSVILDPGERGFRSPNPNHPACPGWAPFPQNMGGKSGLYPFDPTRHSGIPHGTDTPRGYQLSPMIRGVRAMCRPCESHAGERMGTLALTRAYARTDGEFVPDSYPVERAQSIEACQRHILWWA